MTDLTATPAPRRFEDFRNSFRKYSNNGVLALGLFMLGMVLLLPVLISLLKISGFIIYGFIAVGAFIVTLLAATALTLWLLVSLYEGSKKLLDWLGF